MLLHQFIVVALASVRRFESALLSAPGNFRQIFSRDRLSVAEVELEEVETERAA